MKIKCRRPLIVIFLTFVFVLMFLVPVAAQALTVNIAFLSIDNLSANPRYDYLEGIIRGLLLFDLSGVQDIEVVNRSDLDAILREQELQLSNLAEDQNKAIEVGRILGADYLLRGEYVFLGDDVLITVRLIDVVDPQKTGQHFAHTVVKAVSRLKRIDFDVVLVTTSENHAAVIHAIKGAGVSVEKIRFFN